VTSGLDAVLARIAELAPAPAAGFAPAPGPAPAAGFEAALARAAAPGSPGGAAAPYLPAIEEAGRRYGVDPLLLRSLLEQESGFDPAATSPAGAEGLAQLMPATAAALGLTDPYDPAQAIDGGARYLASKLAAYGGDVTLALAAYNAGSGAVDRYGGVPPYPETQAYVRQVLARYGELAGGRSAP